MPSELFSLRLPATSANLGPAFDAAALAMKIFLKVRAQTAEEFSVHASGRDADICGRLEKHLILETYRGILHAQAKKILPLHLEIDNEIPIGKGLGSSASARLAGIALAVHYGKLRWSAERIVAEASRLEHHPDNAAACWMGGMAIAHMASASEAQVAVIRPKGKWPLLLAVPADPLSTEASRRVLPKQYSREDAVANIQSSMLLQAAFAQGRLDLLATALDDRMHQPYRARLCPLLPALQELAGNGGIVGAVLSGAGPAVLLFLNANAPLDRVKGKVAVHLRRRKLAAELIATEIYPPIRRKGVKAG